MVYNYFNVGGIFLNKPVFSIISPEIKQEARIMPFCTFPLTKKCNFKCIYCGYGGELSASMEESQDFNTLVERIFTAHKLGVRKFRFTGGEPFLYPHIEKLIKLFNELGAYLLINTNGSMVENFKHIFNDIQSNIHFAVSFDTNNPEKFDKISGTKNMYERVKRGIEIINNSGRLLRLNMVVTTENKDEIFDIVDYCSQLGCNLKLLDVVSVPLPYGKRENLHVPFIELEDELGRISDRIIDHQYARSFGTPCKIYYYKGVAITVKSTWNGSRYDIKGICNGCEYFPCHEGLYDIFNLPDKRVVGCRWSEESVVEAENFEGQLESMANIFQRAEYVPRTSNPAMKPEPEFVVKSLKKAEEHKNRRDA